MFFIPHIDGAPVDVLKALMTEHGLKQSDLPELGSQGVVSEILAGNGSRGHPAGAIPPARNRQPRGGKTFTSIHTLHAHAHIHTHLEKTAQQLF